ncbi:MAG: glyoxalase/bleomycin resistance/extradiol dioxygenase family protein [Pseudomonadota bacterium]
MNPTPYLFFNGNCREALTAYAEIFGGEIEMMLPFSDMPPGEMDVPDERKDWIMHGAVKFDGGLLMASDDVSASSSPMQGNSVHMALPTNEAGRAAFDALSEDGQVGMPYQKTFWTPGFGTLTDKFGVQWMVSTSETSS